MTADLIVFAQTIHTLESGPSPTAIAIKDGVVTALGDHDEIRREWAGRATRELSLPTGAVTPGLVDGHAHPFSGTTATQGAALAEAENLEEVRRALAGQDAALPPGEWLFGWGLDPAVLGPSPHHGLIDDAAGGRPAVLLFADGHGLLASGAALDATGAGARDVAGIGRDAGGAPTGLALEMPAMRTVVEAMPPSDPERAAAALRQTLLAMARAGLTGLHAMEFPAGSEELLTLLEERDGLPVRLRAFPWCWPGDGPEQWAALAELLGRHGRRWSVGGVKLFMDGTVDNGTAWLRDPDTMGDSTRPLWPDPADYLAALTGLHEYNVPTATHAIGDQAVAYVAAALAELPNRGVRHRIEHLETIDDETVLRIAELGIAVSMQPTHCVEHVRPDGSDTWSRRLGPERAARGWRLADLRDAGVPLILGSDWPVAAFDPRGVLFAALTRRPAGSPSSAPIGPGQAIDAATALAAYSTVPAWSAREEHLAGTIAVGKRADLTAFAVDPLTAPPEEWAAAEVLATVVDGHIVHAL